MGGEAQKPLRFFWEYRKLGHDVILLAHSRNHWHLKDILSKAELDCVKYVDDPNWLLKIYRRTARHRRLNYQLHRMIVLLMWLNQQWQIGRSIRALSRDRTVDLVHVASPISIYTPLMRIGGSELVAVGPLALGPGSSLMSDRVRNEMHRKKRRTGWILNRLLTGKRHADFILHDGDHARDLIERMIAPRGVLIDSIHNGVTEEWFETSRLEEEPERARVVFVGRFVEWKGIKYLLRAAEALPDIDFELIGRGESQKNMEAQVVERSLENVHLHEWMSHPDLRTALASAKVFVSPSYAETGGTSLQEAMAVGVPVIATRWGGHIDRVPEGCGILIDPPVPGSEDAFVQELVSAIVKVTSSKETARSMGRQARQFAREKFLWPSIAKRLIMTIQEMRELDARAKKGAERPLAKAGQI